MAEQGRVQPAHGAGIDTEGGGASFEAVGCLVAGSITSRIRKSTIIYWTGERIASNDNRCCQPRCGSGRVARDRAARIFPIVERIGTADNLLGVWFVRKGIRFTVVISGGTWHSDDRSKCYPFQE